MTVFSIIQPIIRSIVRPIVGMGGGGGGSSFDPIGLNTYDVTAAGSSSTQGGQETPGYSVTSRIASQVTAGSKSVFNRGAGGAFVSALWTTQIPLMTTGEKDGTVFLQCDMNDIDDPTEFGRGLVHAAQVKTNIIDAGLLPVSAAGKRICFWNQTAYESLARIARNRILQESLWARYPGQSINGLEYFDQAPPADATDEADLAGLVLCIPRSYQIADRSHLNDKGYNYIADQWWIPFVEAHENGPPFFATYNYRGNLSTARTNGGDVCQIHYVGSLTGATLSVRNRDGSVNADFGVRVSGSDVFLTRTSSNAILYGWTELYIRASRNGKTRDNRIVVTVGSLGAAPGRVTLDGNNVITIDSNDNTGTFDSPTFSATPRVYSTSAVPATGNTEFSMVFDIEFDASVDGQDVQLWQHGTSEMRRLTTNALRIALHDDAGTALGQITGNTTAGQGRCAGADGRVWIFYSVKTTATTFQNLVFDNGTGTVKQTVATPTPAGSTVRINNLSSTPFSHLMSNALARPFIGKRGTVWMANTAIDWTIAANRALFRSGLNSPVNLPTNGQITIASGVNSGVTVTPFHYERGHAGDMWQGRNYGTGGDFVCLSRHHGNIAGSPDLGRPLGEFA